jgi:hypothetical protein
MEDIYMTEESCETNNDIIARSPVPRRAQCGQPSKFGDTHIKRVLVTSLRLRQPDFLDSFAH